MDCSYSVSRNLLFCAIHQLSQKIDSDIVVRWEKDADVCCEKVVDLALAAILGCKLFGGNLTHLRLTPWNLEKRLIVRFHLRFVFTLFLNYFILELLLFLLISVSGYTKAKLVYPGYTNFHLNLQLINTELINQPKL